MEMGGEFDAGGLNISSNHFEASVSGHVEFKKTCNSGIQGSMLMFSIDYH